MMSHDVIHDVIIGKLYQEPPCPVQRKCRLILLYLLLLLLLVDLCLDMILGMIHLSILATILIVGMLCLPKTPRFVKVIANSLLYNDH